MANPLTSANIFKQLHCVIFSVSSIVEDSKIVVSEK